MNMTKVFLILCLFLFSSFLLVYAQQGPSIRVPKLTYKTRTLANGMKVFTLQERTTPVVAIHVWYKVGSKDDPHGRSGFAHLFEHLMFKGTKHLPPESMDRMTEDVGGWNNASTWDDLTNYFEEVPSNYLERLLWAEAERLSSLKVDDPNFKSERKVVEEEFRQRVLAPPYGMLYYLIDKLSYTTHPYKRPGIGSIEELEAATLDDVKKFHQTYYRPDNATLFVVGDFDQEQLDGWIDKYMGPIAKPDLPLPRVQAEEPPRTAAKTYTEYGANVPLPAVVFTYLIPPITSPDTPVFQVMETLLSKGDSSRLYQSLVYKQEVAASAWANADLREGPGLFAVGAVVAGDKTTDAVQKSLLAEVAKLREAPVDEAELAKAKNQLVTDTLGERETDTGKAFALAYAAVEVGDPEYVNRNIELLQAVTAQDIQRVAKQYLEDKNLVVINYLDQSKRPKEEQEKKGAGATKEGTK